MYYSKCLLHYHYVVNCISSLHFNLSIKCSSSHCVIGKNIEFDAVERLISSNSPSLYLHVVIDIGKRKPI